jgi:peptidyl-prolyl cis-trans isomerase SurA
MVLASAALLTAAAPAKKREVVDRIAAVIENKIITLRELERKAEPYMGKLAEISDPEERKKRRREILRQVLDIEIDDRIVKSEIERARDQLGVTEQDVDQAIQEVLRMNNLDEEQLQGALYAQGVTWSEYRQRLRSQIERARLIQFQVQGKVQIKEADAKRRCQERHRTGERGINVCASHILKRVPAGATPQEIEAIRARLSELQAELASGADFAAFALRHSDDKAAPDGDIGCFGRGEMVEPFEKAAFRLRVGEVSPVVRTSFGFHIIKVTDRRAPPAGDCDDPSVLTTFQNELYQEQLDLQMKAWLRELRKKAFVEIYI